jgi:hypothetical protein
MSLCVHEKLKKHSADLSMLNGHISHYPVRDEDADHLAYVGNGYFGLAVDSRSSDLARCQYYRAYSEPNLGSGVIS